MCNMRANPIGRRPASMGFRVVWFDELVQLAPRRPAADFGAKTVTPCQPLFGSVLEVGEALLHDRRRAVNVPISSQVGVPAGTSAGE
jgi:hypothetical protein